MEVAVVLGRTGGEMAFDHTNDCRALNTNLIDGPGAPCLFCGGCPWCCEDALKLLAKEPRKGKGKGKGELWQCPKCGIKTEFEMGHAMVGCEPQPEGRP